MSRIKTRPFKMSESAYASMLEEFGGFCISCREEVSGVEPDARNYGCENCGKPRVFGVEELLVMGLITLKEES
jgi:hypothetical protein